MNNKLERFMNGFSAAAVLANRAAKNGFAIEYICLAVSLIDGLLRMGLILRHQIDTKSTDILETLLHQANEDKIVFEKQVYSMAFRKKLIDELLYGKLKRLYDERNRVIHRFVISDISTEDVMSIGVELESILPIVKKSVWDIEEEQLKLGVGMTRKGTDSLNRTLKQRILEMSAKKHGDPLLAQKLSEFMD